MQIVYETLTCLCLDRNDLRGDLAEGCLDHHLCTCRDDLCPDLYLCPYPDPYHDLFLCQSLFHETSDQIYRSLCLDLCLYLCSHDDLCLVCLWKRSNTAMNIALQNN